MEEYLELKHLSFVKQIVNGSSFDDIDFKALQVNLVDLSKENKDLFDKVMYRDNIWAERVKWTKALEKLQKKVLDTYGETSAYSSVKEGFPVTFVNHPKPGMKNHRFDNIFKLIEVNAKVLGHHEVVKEESYRTYKCRKCKQITTVFANRLHNTSIEDPKKCATRGCLGTLWNTATETDEIDLDHYIDFQKIEVCLLDSVDEELIVELDEELVDTCFPGDQVTLLGVLETRSERDVNDFEIVLRAASVRVNNEMQTFDTENIWEIHCEVYDDFNTDLKRLKGDEFLLRDEMISSVAVELHGLAMVKLALLCVLCSGGEEKEMHLQKKCLQDMQRTEQREIIHLLMIGQPGCGKSQILKAAMKIPMIAVNAVGYCEPNTLFLYFFLVIKTFHHSIIASTAAGLTAAVSKENKSNYIQAGALVKANNGILCIDELNLFGKEHRSSIHEALEHQMISINKGI